MPVRSVLLLSQYYHPDPSATAYFITDIAEGLAARGFDVQVMCGQPSYTQGLAAELTSELRNGVNIKRVFLAKMDRASTRSRLRTQLEFSAKAFTRLLRAQRPDAVLSVTCPPMLTWLAPAARARGSAFVPIIHDVYPEIAQVLGKAGGVSSALFASVERNALRRSNAVVVLGECQKRVIEGKLQGKPVPVHVIAHWAKRDVETTPVRPRASNAWLKQLGIEHKFVIQYSGNVGLFHGLEVLPETLSLLPADRFHLLLVGEGQRRAYLEQEFQRRGLSNVSFVPHRRDAELGETLGACDVALVCLHPTALGLCVPSKLYGILAAGRPVCAVAASDSETALTVSRYGAGTVVAPEQPQALAAALLGMANSPELTAAQGRAARACYDAHFTRERAIDAYATVLRAL